MRDNMERVSEEEFEAFVTHAKVVMDDKTFVATVLESSVRRYGFGLL